MKKRNIIIALMVIFIIIIVIIVGNLRKIDKKINDNIKIVTSFYPIYIMTLNITDGIQDIEVSNMAEMHTGCIHDYTLTTSDLKKFENADIFIENGHGIEEFTDKILESYSDIKVIDSSKNITNIISDDDEINAHFWTSIDSYILQVKEITLNLKQLDNKNAEKYEQNCLKYVLKLEDLKKEYSSLSKIKNKKVISLNESFSYLLQFIELDETLIESDHEQSTLSAEKMKEIIDKMKKESIDSIIISEEDNDQNANTIKSETGANIYKLKDGMSGDNSLDSYINTMKDNLNILLGMKGIN